MSLENSKERLLHLVSYGFITNKNKVWFYNYTYGAIAELDLDTGNIKVVWHDKSELFWGINQYGGGAWYENKLIFAPREANHILIYDTVHGKTQFVPIDTDKNIGSGVFNKFVDAQAYGNCIYFFPGRYKTIVKLNMKTMKVEYIEGFFDEIGEVGDNNKVMCAVVEYIGNGVFLMPAWQSGKIVRFDSKTDKVTSQTVSSNKIADLCMGDSGLWVAFKEVSKIARIDEDGTIKEEYDLNIEGVFEQPGCRYIFELNNKLYIVPFCGKAIIEFELESLKSKACFYLPNEYTPLMKSLCSFDRNMFAFKKSDNEKIIMFECKKGEIIVMDENSEPKEYSTYLKWENKKQMISCVNDMIKNNLNVENAGITLNDFLEVII